MNLLPQGATVAKTTLAASVYETLVESFVSGGLVSGTELNEIALAKELNVSRTPVHEALLRLQAEGFIEQEANRKPRVRLFARADLVDLYEMRKLLECAAAKRATARLSEETVAELRRASETLAQASAEPNWSAQASTYHRRVLTTMAAAAGNKQLRTDIERYQLLDRSFGRVAGTLAGLRQTLREHAPILDLLTALEARDALAARAAVLSHIEARESCVLAAQGPPAP